MGCIDTFNALLKYETLIVWLKGVSLPLFSILFFNLGHDNVSNVNFNFLSGKLFFRNFKHYFVRRHTISPLLRKFEKAFQSKGTHQHVTEFKLFVRKFIGVYETSPCSFAQHTHTLTHTCTHTHLHTHLHTTTHTHFLSLSVRTHAISLSQTHTISLSLSN